MISIFLPIRKGSKRIINKNLKKLPYYKFGLTELKLNQIKKFRLICSRLKHKFEFIVSTDNKKVIKIAKEIPWIIIHKRNKEMSTDDSLGKLIEHVPKICSGKYILWTHVTSPFFNENDYFNFIKIFINKAKHSKKRKSAFSADKIQKFVYREDNKWISHDYKKKKWPRTQDLLNSYVVNSAAFIASRDVYLKMKDRLCKNPIPIISRPNAGFDVDDIKDFNYVKKNLKKNGPKSRKF